MERNTVFLDIDGVLVNHRSWYDRDPVTREATADPLCVEALNYLTDKANAVIVVSSSWRVGRSIIQLRELMARWKVKAPVADKTPNLDGRVNDIYVGKTRGQEIDAFLKGPGGERVAEFVILDDDNDMFPHLGNHVQCSFDVGLTKAGVDRALEILKVKVKGVEK